MTPETPRAGGASPPAAPGDQPARGASLPSAYAILDARAHLAQAGSLLRFAQDGCTNSDVLRQVLELAEKQAREAIAALHRRERIVAIGATVEEPAAARALARPNPQ